MSRLFARFPRSLPSRSFVGAGLPLLLAAALSWGCAPAAITARPAPEPSTQAPAPAPTPGADEAAAGGEVPPATAATPSSAVSGEDAAPPAGGEEAERAALRERIVEAARSLLGKRPRLDCSGYVLAAYRGAGLSIELAPARNRSLALWTAGREVPTPAPGDLAFFHDTYDRNRNGRVDDGITHVALVESVEGSSVVLLHRGVRKVERLRMDLERPSDRASNDPLRFRRTRDAPGTRYLSGELFTAFGALLDPDVTPMFQTSHTEDTAKRHPARRWQSTETRQSRSAPASSRSTRRRAPSRPTSAD